MATPSAAPPVVFRVALLPALLVALAGCRSGPQAELDRAIRRFAPGMSRAEVRALLGPPARSYRASLHAGFYGLPPELWEALGPTGEFEMWTYAPCPPGSPDAAEEGDVEYYVFFGGAPDAPPPDWRAVTYDGKDCANPPFY